MFSSSATPFGTGSGFGTGTSKLFFLFISNQSVYKMFLTSQRLLYSAMSSSQLSLFLVVV